MKKLLLLTLTIALLFSSVCMATVSSFSKDGPFTGTGVVGQQFTITFDFFSTSEIIATTRVTATGLEATLVLTTD